MNVKERELVVRLLVDQIRLLRRFIREQESLSVPCPPGRWRWADAKGAYGRKSEEELAADRVRAVQRAADFRDELAVAESVYRELSAEMVPS
jgi:hypothetical protein